MAHVHDTALSQGTRRRLLFVLGLTSLVLVVEAIGGFLTGSLALVADAGHMLADVGGIALALVATKLAERAPTAHHTYGYHRAEILAALVNAVVLAVVSVSILLEAWRRLGTPREVASGPMLAIAVVGLLANLVSVALLHSGAGHSLNLRGAYFEVLSDLLASVGVIAAAGAIRMTGWLWVDAAVSGLIALAILPRSFSLLRETVSILLEGTPSHIALDVVHEAITAVPGVGRVHDLHVWTLTSRRHILTAHVLLDGAGSDSAVLETIRTLAMERFDIDHVTVQVERTPCPAGSACAELTALGGCRPQR